MPKGNKVVVSQSRSVVAIYIGGDLISEGAVYIHEIFLIFNLPCDILHTEGPCITRILGLEKKNFIKICVSGTVLNTQLMLKNCVSWDYVREFRVSGRHPV